MFRSAVFVIMSVLALGAGCALDAEPAAIASAELSGLDGNAYVNFHRGRLLDNYAARKGLGGRAGAWASLNSKQRYLFLLQTDLLGNRSYMTVQTSGYRKNNPWDGCPNNPGADCSGSCTVMSSRFGGQACVTMSGPECAHPPFESPMCSEVSLPRWDFSMALEHVTQLYEILGYGSPGTSCDSKDNNRIFWAGDDALIGGWRNEGTALPEWLHSQDIGGPHAPFNVSRETATGRPFSNDGPDGQTQFYGWDWQAQWFLRGSAWLPPDGKMFELDNDFNTIHDSSPECWYGGEWGVYEYISHFQYKGNAQPVDLSYWGY